MAIIEALVEYTTQSGYPEMTADGRLKIAAGEGQSLPVSAAVRACLGCQTLSVTTGAVVSLTPPAGAVAAMIQADGAAVSMTLDGTNPTATVGTRIDDGVILHIDSVLSAVRLIARSATTNVQVAYFDKA